MQYLLNILYVNEYEYINIFSYPLLLKLTVYNSFQMSKYTQNSSFQRSANPNSRHYTWSQHDNQNTVDPNYLHPNKYKQSHNTSPFTNKRHIRQESSGLDSIENLMQSRQSAKARSGYDKKQYASYQSQQIAFLKQKLIQIHNKLLKQLETTNKLGSQKQNLIRDLKSNQRTIGQLQDKIRTLEHQLDETNRLLSHRVQKNQQKYRSVENRLQDENKKNFQLKEDLQSVRNKILETMMEKNMLQQANVQFKQNLKIAQRNNAQLQKQVKQRDEHITILQKQISILNNKCNQMDQQITLKNHNIQQLEKIVNQKKGAQKQLQHLCKMQQQKNTHILHDLGDLEAENNQLHTKLKLLQKQSEKQKDQIYWLKNNNEKTNRNLNEQIEKLTEQLEAMNIMYKEVQTQLNFLRNKPIQDAQKKRRHYEITRQFVHQLENQQQLYGNSGSRGTSNNNTSLRSPPTQPVPIRSSIANKKVSPTKSSMTTINKSSNENDRNYGYFQSKSPTYKPESNSYANLMRDQSGYQQQKNKYVSNASDVGQLQGTLFNCNLERKKLKAEIQRIDQNKVKTRQMIVKRKKLEEQLQFQQKKIQKLKQELRKLRTS